MRSRTWSVRRGAIGGHTDEEDQIYMIPQTNAVLVSTFEARHKALLSGCARVLEHKAPPGSELVFGSNSSGRAGNRTKKRPSVTPNGKVQSQVKDVRPL